MRHAFFLALGLLVALAGCKPEGSVSAPPPQAVSASATAQFCGMLLSEHPGPKGQIFTRDQPQPFWFASVRDTLAFTLMPEMPKAIIAIYVNDMGRAQSWDQPESWVDARKASFVIGSNRRGGMGEDELIPFGDAEAAQRFAAENGGHVVAYAEVPRDSILAEGQH